MTLIRRPGDNGKVLTMFTCRDCSETYENYIDHLPQPFDELCITCRDSRRKSGTLIHPEN